MVASVDSLFVHLWLRLRSVSFQLSLRSFIAHNFLFKGFGVNKEVYLSLGLVWETAARHSFFRLHRNGFSPCPPCLCQQKHHNMCSTHINKYTALLPASVLETPQVYTEVRRFPLRDRVYNKKAMALITCQWKTAALCMIPSYFRNLHTFLKFFVCFCSMFWCFD